MSTYFTDHARARMQQRGISAAAIDLLLSYGRSSPADRGAEIVFFDKSVREAQRLSRIYAILGADGRVLTVGHRFRRIPRS